MVVCSSAIHLLFLMVLDTGVENWLMARRWRLCPSFYFISYVTCIFSFFYVLSHFVFISFVFYCYLFYILYFCYICNRFFSCGRDLEIFWCFVIKNFLVYLMLWYCSVVFLFIRHSIMYSLDFQTCTMYCCTVFLRCSIVYFLEYSCFINIVLGNVCVVHVRCSIVYFWLFKYSVNVMFHAHDVCYPSLKYWMTCCRDVMRVK